MSKTRLDVLLVQRGLVETRTRAQALIMAGAVQVEGHVQTKPGTTVADTCALHVTETMPYVSRGGYKLAHALDTFQLNPAGHIALDVGASTGGFTDVLIQRNAHCVYAVDVGYGVLDWRLRQHERVVVIERTNIRYLTSLPPLPPRPSLPTTSPISIMVSENSSTVWATCATIDVSFISLKIVLPAVQRLLIQANTTWQPWIVALIKPQFEAGKHDVGKGGVVRNIAIHRRVVRDIIEYATTIGLSPCGITRSPIQGPAGNVEFLAWFALHPNDATQHFDDNTYLDTVLPI